MKKLLTITLVVFSLYLTTICYSSEEYVGIIVKNPSPSPTGAEVVFEANFDGPVNLWITGIDGTNLHKLTSNTGIDEEPAWSPNGKPIAFASTKADVTDIWSIYPDGSHFIKLTSNSLNNRQPTWSPDGTKIAFVSDRGGSNDIWIMNADGSSQNRITHLTGQENHPSFSPNGDQIVFSETDNGSATLMIVNVDGSNIVPLTTGSSNNDWNPQWTANGIVFSSNRDTSSEHWKIWIIQPNGSGLKKVGDTLALDPVPLPNNGLIIFSDEFSNTPSDTVLSEISMLDPISGTKNVVTSVSTFLPKGDTNNDGIVNCSDMFIIKSIIGKKLGQSGFNPRADANSDGIIDVRDLAYVSQQLPKGSTCK
jgi:Tol biopolymer transport system component